MKSVGTAPVTFGQLSVLRTLHFTGADGESFANLVCPFRVPMGVSLDAVDEAWFGLVAAHESLRTTFNLTKSLQIVNDIDRFVLERLEAPDSHLDAILERAKEWSDAPFRIEAEIPWRACVVTHRGVPLYLIAVMHHVAVDHAAADILEKQFGQLLSGEQLPPQPQPRELATAQHDDHQLVLDYWISSWGRFVEEDQSSSDQSHRVRCGIYSSIAMKSARRLATSLNVSVQSVVLGATILTLLNAKGRNSATLGLIVSNRLDENWSPLVASMNQLVPLTLATETSETVDTYLKRVYMSCLDVYMHGSYHVDELKRQLRLAGHPNPDPLSFGCYFNYYGEGSAPDPHSQVATSAEWMSVPPNTGPRFHFRAVPNSDGLHLSLMASRDYLPPDIVGTFAASVEAALVSMEKGAESLDSIDYTALRPIPSLPTI